MKGRTDNYSIHIFAAVFILLINASAIASWHAPFDTAATSSKSVDSILTLENALELVAIENPVLKSLDFQLKAAGSGLKQAGLWPNPELDVEFEEFGWDAPGFRESEFAVTFSQEFELFGQLGARKNLAKAEMNVTRLKTKLSAFDLYLETKRRFYSLAHAQQAVYLSQESDDLAKGIVDNIEYRLDEGAALQSELFLAQLEEQRTLLTLDRANQEVVALETSLASLWKKRPSGAKISIDSEPDINVILESMSLLTDRIDSTRDIIQMYSQSNLLQAERKMAAAEARPTITLTGGFKRLEINNSNSFLLGVSLPIPLFNRNQGTSENLDSRLNALEYDIEQARSEARSEIETHRIRLIQLKDRHSVLDTLLLSTAHEAYQELKSAYDAGRVPYVQLLEAERTLNNLSFEHNDVLLEIYQEIIALERLTGVVMFAAKEK